MICYDRNYVWLATLVAVIVTCGTLYGGGEMPASEKVSRNQPVCAVPCPHLPAKEIGPPGGDLSVKKAKPLPAPRRFVGQGFSLHEDYGPTYYYPASHNLYEGLNPKYYPFYHPRLWPNYKASTKWSGHSFCGRGASGGYWDEYDNWLRGGRYEERQ
jgi:hypothetical protein